MLEIRSKDIKLVDVDSIIPNPKNANRHSIEQIKRLEKLIKYQGFRNPLIISNRTGFLIAGHGRLEAAKNLGIEKLPVIYQDFENEAQEYAYLVSDNEIARWAELDKQAVYEDLKNIELDDIELLGIEDFEIPDVEVLDPQTDEDEVPEVEHPITRRGDIWLLGKHRLMCGDSTMIDDVEKLMNGENIEAVYTDPPYGIDIDFNEKFASQNGSGAARRNSYQKIHGDESTKTANDVILLCKSLDFKKMLFWGANYYPENLGGSKCWISWYKKDNLPSDTFCDTELAWTNMDKHSKTLCVQWKGMIKQGESGQKRVHPNQKPIMLAQQCFEYMGISGSVIDFFGGSGSTMIAAESKGIKSYTMEFLEHYCDVIIKRWQNFTGKKATLESTGQTYEELKAEREND